MSKKVCTAETSRKSAEALVANASSSADSTLVIRSIIGCHGIIDEQLYLDHCNGETMSHSEAECHGLIHSGNEVEDTETTGVEKLTTYKKPKRHCFYCHHMLVDFQDMSKIDMSKCPNMS
jgi:hypothetical protein